MSYTQYLRGQASECVGIALETTVLDEAASLLELAQACHRRASVAQPERRLRRRRTSSATA